MSALEMEFRFSYLRTRDDVEIDLGTQILTWQLAFEQIFDEFTDSP
jgi:hypothetical protein